MNDQGVDVRRLRLLLELSRLGSMADVADTLGTTTSSVSQQLARLAQEAGAVLLEPAGRGVRLTPAGRRLADHAVTILAAVDAARLDLDPDAEPVGTVRVGGFATAVRTSLLPVLAGLRRRHPGVETVISEQEPLEAFTLLGHDDLDLALTYDYDLAPAAVPAVLAARPLWRTPWGLAVPTDELDAFRADQAADLTRWGGRAWIVNSRNTADEEAVRTLGNLAGFTPRIAHHIDSLELVEDLVARGLGVGLLPLERPTREGVRVLALPGPAITLTAYAVTRRGRERWSPLRAVLEHVAAGGAPQA